MRGEGERGGKRGGGTGFGDGEELRVRIMTEFYFERVLCSTSSWLFAFLAVVFLFLASFRSHALLGLFRFEWLGFSSLLFGVAGTAEPPPPP